MFSNLPFTVDLNIAKRNVSIQPARKKLAILKLNQAPIMRDLRSPTKRRLNKIGSNLIR